MSKPQKCILAVALAVVLLMSLFPPWKKIPSDSTLEEHLGYRPLFFPPKALRRVAVPQEIVRVWPPANHAEESQGTSTEEREASLEQRMRVVKLGPVRYRLEPDENALVIMDAPRLLVQWTVVLVVTGLLLMLAAKMMPND